MEEEQLEKVNKNGTGDVVPFAVTVNSSYEASDIYLKHAFNESSEDEEGTENTCQEETDEKGEKEFESFTTFLERHKKEQAKRENNQQSKPSTSKDL